MKPSVLQLEQQFRRLYALLLVSRGHFDCLHLPPVAAAEIGSAATFFDKAFVSFFGELVENLELPSQFTLLLDSSDGSYLPVSAFLKPFTVSIFY